MPQTSLKATGPLPESSEIRPREAAWKRLLGRVLGIDKLDAVYAQLADHHDRPEVLHREAIRTLDLRIVADARIAERMPKTGPLIVVANHPSGVAEGLALEALLAELRPDYKIMANAVLERFPAFARSIIAVDPFGGPDSMRANLSGMKKAAQHLRGGGTIVVFPAGEVAAYKLKTRAIEEAAWSDTIARLAIMSRAAVLPVHITAANSRLFHAAGLLNRKLRTALLARELLRQSGRSIRLRAGRLIAPERIRELGQPERITAYLRHCTLMLGQPAAPNPVKSLRRKKTRKTFIGDLPIMAQPPKDALVAEFQKIRLATLCGQVGKLSVHLAEARQIPLLLMEIGRLREISFRAAGEGSGEECDLDEFDGHYKQLFVWDEETQEIAGAYRLCETWSLEGPIEAAKLYTSRLFGYDEAFLRKIGPALELGRSFVSPSHQSDFGTLHLLWKGIGDYIARHPRNHTLIGAVSMSASYREESRELLVSHLSQNHLDVEHQGLLKPERPFVARTRASWSAIELGRMTSDIRELSALIEDLEPSGHGVPVLWRHYLKLGARVAAFNVDAEFADVVDGLIVVNLDDTPMRTLQRYMGSDFAKALRGLQNPETLSI